jgi:hypothetical protein
MADQVILQEWQSYFVAFAGASAALAGLVFVAMSLHPGPILVNALTRGRAFVAAFGFLIGVAWALIMLLPARTAPVGAVLLIALGVVESAFIIYLQFQGPQNEHKCCAPSRQRYSAPDACPRGNHWIAAAVFRSPFRTSGHRGWHWAVRSLLSIMDARTT